MPLAFRSLLLLALPLALVASRASAQTPSFLTFETGQVRPLAMMPNGNRLLAVNTPDNTLEVFSINQLGIVPLASVPVGMEPSAVAVLSESEAWVVNHLSDSVSIVDLVNYRVTRTLLVGDEPRDIVFADPDGAGPLAKRAFITTAHRGQHRTHSSISAVAGAGDPQLTTPSVGRADVWVFDTGALGSTVGGTPLEIVSLFGDTPRALAVSNDESTVYAAVFLSGNQTAVVPEGMVCDGFGAAPCGGDGITSPNGLGGGNLPGGNPGPATDHNGAPAPEVGLVVQYDEASGQWRDEAGRNWSNGIRFTLPDHDVFAIDTDTLATTADHEHVGTTIFNMAVHPGTGVLYVTNTDAQNLTRFEGPGTFGGSTVQGNLAHARITLIDGATVTPRHLNSHVDYATLPAPAGVKDHSLSTPTDLVISSGGTVYVAAFGSSKVGVIDAADLVNGTFDPTAASADYIDVSGGGPGGLALDEPRNRLYVLTRFDNSISVVDLGTGSESNHIPLHNPEPAEVVAGRPFLYDARFSSSNGEAACASCHIFGDFDGLAWDLGNPDDDVKDNPQPINFGTLVGFFPGGGAGLNGTGNVNDIHPMKGPMATQTLRGMVTSGHMHWRGDRARGFCGDDDPHTNDSELSFKNFIVAFGGLLGDDSPIALADCNGAGFMQQFTDFALEIMLPPNPVRNLDNSLTADQQSGADFFGGPRLSDGSSFVPGATGFTCNGCHSLDPSQGFFGTGGNASFENEPQIVKIPHLRNLYQKVGMFGMPNVPFNLVGDGSHQGDQVRGTGFLHDGSTDTLFRFFTADVFEPGFILNDLNVGFDGGDPQRRDMEEFMLAFDTDLAPIVGQQVTLTSAGGTDANDRITLMIQRAEANFTSAVLGGTVKECELVVKGVVAGEKRGWVYDPNAQLFQSDRVASTHTDGQIRAFANVAGQAMTYTCAPPGSGTRMGVDRDEDGQFDRDERDAGTDPANPGSVVGACNDGIDNDGDGLTDFAGGDPGCRDAGWNIENPECDDGYDNDNDGGIDGADVHCTVSYRLKERKTGCGLIGIEPFLVLGFAGRVSRRRRGR